MEPTMIDQSHVTTSVERIYHLDGGTLEIADASVRP
jgi:hypothetical protein